MGLRAEPDLQKHLAQGSVHGHFFSSVGMQGWRRNMEDNGVILDLPNGVSVAALFDGHGGEEVSGYLAKHFATGLGVEGVDLTDEGLKKHYMDVDASIWDPEGAAQISSCTNGPKSRPATHRMKLLQMKNASPDLPHAAVEGRLITETCGSTAVSCLFCGDSDLVVVNTGDSRCILSSDGVAKDLSSDHSLKDPAEVARVNAAGYEVSCSNSSDTLRIGGTLAVPRAMGDFSFKQSEDIAPDAQAVIALPDVVRHTISPQDEFVVLACDGVFDVKSSQEVVDFIRMGLVEPSQAAQNLTPTLISLLDECCAKEIVAGGMGLDNMSICVIFLPK